MSENDRRNGTSHASMSASSAMSASFPAAPVVASNEGLAGGLGQLQGKQPQINPLASRHLTPKPLASKPLAPVALSANAVARIQRLMQGHAGVRVSLAKGGCSGTVYDISVVNAPVASDEIVETEGARVFIAVQSLLFLVGSTIDVESNDLEERFVVRNPNEKGRCGCGQSFFV